MTYEEVLDAARLLGWDDRSRLIYTLENEMEAEREATPLTDEQKTELKRRLARHRANPDEGIPWEEVRVEMRKRFGGS